MASLLFEENILWPTEQRRQTHKVRENEMAEEYVPDEGQDKTPEEQLSEVEISNLPEKEFRVMIVKMIQDLRKKKKKRTHRTRRYKKSLTKS